MDHTEPRPSRTRPPGTDTGYRHERCYAKDLADCDTQISREHYISESVLADPGREFKVTRARLGWEARPLTANPLAANMLCRRHNSALSCLDVVGRAGPSSGSSASPFSPKGFGEGALAFALLVVLMLGRRGRPAS